EAAEMAQEQFTAQFAELVSHLAERLQPGPDGQKKVFKDSAVKNLAEFFERFEKLKVQDGDALDQAVQQAKELLGGWSAKDLRGAPALKEDIAQGLAAIEQQLAPLVVKAPRRKLLL